MSEHLTHETAAEIRNDASVETIVRKMKKYYTGSRTKETSYIQLKKKQGRLIGLVAFRAGTVF